MGKLLFWIVAIALIWSVITLIRVSQRKQERAQADAEARGRSGAAGADGRGPAGGRGARARAGGRAPEKIVACGHCGVYLPFSDAVHGRGSDGGEYCCVEHRDAARR